jgi:hypothetical protein
MCDYERQQERGRERERERESESAQKWTLNCGGGQTGGSLAKGRDA